MALLALLHPAADPNRRQRAASKRMRPAGHWKMIFYRVAVVVVAVVAVVAVVVGGVVNGGAADSHRAVA